MDTATTLLAALQSLQPVHLALENESHQHAGYYDGKQSHFKLTIASQAFDGIRLAARHQKIYALADEFLMNKGGTIHALAIFAYTPDEWASIAASPDSPLCASRRNNNNQA